MVRYFFLFSFILLNFSCQKKASEHKVSGTDHLKNIRPITKNIEGWPRWDNAEAYFSSDGKKLIFQATRDGRGCDQIYIMNIDGSDVHMVSTGKGRTTCSYFFPGDRNILYASTHLISPDCPPVPKSSQGYTWPLYSYDIFTAHSDGSNLIRLTSSGGYDAEATVSPLGDKIVFTSNRDGDLELYTMNPDGSDQRRLTFSEGYDGGAFFSPDGKRIVFRARYPTTDEERKDYQGLLAQNLTRLGQLDIYICDADGSNKVRVTHLGDKGVTSWSPFMHPDGKRIAFVSNMDDYDKTVPGDYGYNFELYIINMDGTGLERLTVNDHFDAFPMFSPDGKHLVWCGNYNPDRPRDTDVMMADWVD